jgi:hypothetical protein
MILVALSYNSTKQSGIIGSRPKDALECGCEAAALNKPNKEGGSFAAALQGLRRRYIKILRVHPPGSFNL